MNSHLYYRLLFLGLYLLAQLSYASPQVHTTRPGKILLRKINFNCNTISTKEILDRISEQYNVSFAYSDALPFLKNPLSIHCKSKPLIDVLQELFPPASISIKEMEDIIVISKKSSPLQKTPALKEETSEEIVFNEKTKKTNGPNAYNISTPFMGDKILKRKSGQTFSSSNYEIKAQKSSSLVNLKLRLLTSTMTRFSEVLIWQF